MTVLPFHPAGSVRFPTAAGPRLVRAGDVAAIIDRGAGACDLVLHSGVVRVLARPGLAYAAVMQAEERAGGAIVRALAAGAA